MTTSLRALQRVPHRVPDRRFKIAWRVTQWPTDDQKLWAMAFDRSAGLDEQGGGVDLAVPTRKRLEYAYGRWLAFLATTAPQTLELPIQSRLRRDFVEAFIALLAETNRWTSIVGVLGALRSAIGLLEPECNLDWLRRIEARINRQARPLSRMKRFVAADALHAYGLRLMDEAEADFHTAQTALAAGLLAVPLRKNPRIGLLKAAVRYRDGLVIAILTQASLRRRNIAALSITEHLQQTGTGWSMVIPAEQTKGGVELDYPLSASLSDRLDLYVSQFRPEFPGAKVSTNLLLSAWNGDLTPGDLYESIVKRTQAEFGHGINLHFFRHITATFIAIESPANALMIRDFLGHRSGASADEHYKKAQGVAASRRASEIIAGITTRGTFGQKSAKK